MNAAEIVGTLLVDLVLQLFCGLIFFEYYRYVGGYRRRSSHADVTTTEETEHDNSKVITV